VLKHSLNIARKLSKHLGESESFSSEKSLVIKSCSQGRAHLNVACF
jgi:hypothetical protein